MKFLNKIVTDLLARESDLSKFNIVLPGKRPIVFIKKILRERQYSGFLPTFFTIEDLITELAGKTPVQGIAMWLFAFEVYRSQHPSESFADLLKDWDDISKFAEDDTKVLEYMVSEERIKNWAENLGDQDENAVRKHLNFWQRMNSFIPLLQLRLEENGWATAGMMHKTAREKIEFFAQNTDEKYVFCGFNAFTPVEERLVKNLLQWDRAIVFFQGDNYYVNDERQEAGKFLRQHKTWKEFNDSRPFYWIEDDFMKDKNIKVYEVSGNVSQTKVLPSIFSEIESENLADTAVVLLDENLLPAALDALAAAPRLNITMGFPLKNLAFSNAMKRLFYLQKQLEISDSSYYYNDVLSILEELPNSDADKKIVLEFRAKIEERNIIYISRKLLQELLGNLSYFNLFQKQQSVSDFLDLLVSYCYQLKFGELDNIQYENISHFEKSFKIIKNQLSPYSFPLSMETLEVLINQLINSETIDFEGEPLEGLQVMGLLETRLLNFENIILLSANEGKLPLGNTQNTYVPFGVRRHFGLHTFLENDSIYAYHFYRLLQDSANVNLLFNALNSGVNSGEKSRFITQLEIEDNYHQIEHIIIENSSEPILLQPMQYEKTAPVISQLEIWKSRVSASHLTSYIYDPVDFYLNKILHTREGEEMEEELSQRSYGNLVHYALQHIYEKLVGKILVESDLSLSDEQIDEALRAAIEELKHQPEFYDRGMNFIHKSIAERVVRNVVQYDRQLIAEGNALEIIGVEQSFTSPPFYLDEDRTDSVAFYGFIDRIDRLNGNLRIIDFKTAKTKCLAINYPKTADAEEKLQNLFFSSDYKQAMQLSIYAYLILNSADFTDNHIQCGIWSFAEVNKGVQTLNLFGNDEINKVNLETPMDAVKNVILDILDPQNKFVESVKTSYDF